MTNKPRIFVVDGPSGSGKTTLLTGTSNRSPELVITPNLEEMATIFSELQTKARTDLEIRSDSDLKQQITPFLYLLFDYELKERIPGLKSLIEGEIVVLDKSHYHMFNLAQKLGEEVPKEIKDFYKSIRYEQIFLCEPIKSYIISRKGKTLELSNAKLTKLQGLYEREGYSPILLPAFDDREMTAKSRYEKIKSFI